MSSREHRRRSTRDDPRYAAPGSPTSPASATGDYPPLSPPRPFFIAGRDRASYSSTDTSPDTGSDSDRDAPAPLPRQRNHTRRRSSSGPQQYAAVEPHTPTTADPFIGSNERDLGWSPAQLYADDGQPRARVDSRAPPSAFPFQAHPGNPDPGMHIPGQPSRRSSLESLRMRPSSDGHSGYATASGYGGYGQLHQNPSETDLGRPYAPFMNGTEEQRSPGNSRPSSIHSAGGTVYRNSAAGAMGGSHHDLPRSPSTQTFRAPFLSPASRPTSSLWAPPTFPYGSGGLGSGSSTALSVPVKGRAPMPSSRLASKLTKEDKPWLKKRESLGRTSWWVTFLMMVIGIAISAYVCWSAWNSVELLSDDQLCNVLDEDFSSGSINTDIWSREVQLGGFGNGEFQMASGDDKNAFVKNGQLYIKPTLITDEITTDQMLGNDPFTYTLDPCTSADTNASECAVSSDKDSNAVINPVKSAKIWTKDSVSIKYGKVEVRAKLPTGDWLWPAIWMLPVNSTYGAWPLSGEIDIMEARGNDATYPDQGDNYVRATLNFGVTNSTQAREFGWQSMKRDTYAAAFHTYTLEWSPEFIRVSVDNRLHRMLQLSTKKKSYFDIGNFPKTARDGDSVVAITNPWTAGGRSAPFDQDFYLIIDLAVGGTSGWFPDGDGGKPWIDGSATAMTDFAKKMSTWSKTWPSNEDDLAFRIDSVKMWKMC